MLRRCIFLLIFLNFSQSSFAEGPSVIIVGAGAAGIAAATKLLEHSITNITILEAENRIGGRIHSVHFGKVFVDLGAEYCYGTNGNIVYELVKNYNILESKEFTLENNIFYSNGSKMDNELVQDFEETIFGYYVQEQYGNDTRTGLSTGEDFISRYKSTLLRKYKNDSSTLEIVKEGLRFAENMILLIEGSYSWFDVSAHSDFQELEGDWDQVVKKVGFHMVLDILMKNHRNIEDNIYLKQKVTKINWKHDRSVTVHTSQQNSYTADFLIFTPSVGVLKDRKDTLFHPSLPARKEEAIQALNFASVAKIIAYFPTKWWRYGDNYFSFFWKDTDLKATDFPKGPMKNGVSWVTQIVDFRKLDGNVWEAWISGEMVPEIEKQPLEILMNGLHYVLRRFLSKSYDVVDASHILKTSWCVNENFRGGFVSVKPGYYKKEVSYPGRLAEPLKNDYRRPALLFAGDATHPHFTSTVHGAIESGYREAERIIKFYKNAN